METNEPTPDQELETKPFNLPSQQLPSPIPINQEAKKRRVASMIKWAKDNGLYKPLKGFSG